MQISFFTGPECSLCDDAKALLAQLPEHQQPKVTEYNIRENTNHYHLYAVRIPVLKRDDTGDELGWPFDLTTLKHFLQ